MAKQPSRPGFMIVGGFLFLAMPFLWSTAVEKPIDWRLVAVGIGLAALSFYLAAKYRRQRASAPSQQPPNER